MAIEIEVSTRQITVEHNAEQRNITIDVIVNNQTDNNINGGTP